VPNDKIKSELRKTNMIFMLFIILSIFISLCISIYIVLKFNNPVKEIARLISQADKEEIKNSRTSLEDIKQHVQNMNSTNDHYDKQNNKKDSLLKSFLYQYKIKNIYNDINKIIDETLIMGEYIIIYFKVHYKEMYFQQISEQSSIGTFY